MLLNTPYKDFLQLLRWTVRQDFPESNPLTTPLSELLQIAQFHQMEAFLYQGIVQLQWTENDESSLTIWQQEHDKALKRFILFQHERQQLLAKFEEKGIWYAPLKGLVLQPYYPQPYQRQMTDNDILFDTQCQKEVKQLMLQQGFYQKSSQHHIDTYMKKPILNFEMHLKASVHSDFDN